MKSNNVLAITLELQFLKQLRNTHRGDARRQRSGGRGGFGEDGFEATGKIFHYLNCGVFESDTFKNTKVGKRDFRRLAGHQRCEKKVARAKVWGKVSGQARQTEHVATTRF